MALGGDKTHLHFRSARGCAAEDSRTPAITRVARLQWVRCQMNDLRSSALLGKHNRRSRWRSRRNCAIGLHAVGILGVG